LCQASNPFALVIFQAKAYAFAQVWLQNVIFLPMPLGLEYMPSHLVYLLKWKGEGVSLTFLLRLPLKHDPFDLCLPSKLRLQLWALIQQDSVFLKWWQNILLENEGIWLDIYLKAASNTDQKQTPWSKTSWVKFLQKPFILWLYMCH
jgi:hypothetical protein